MAIVYRHRRLDTNEIFYIGIGRDIKRAFDKHKRNRHWLSINNNTTIDVEILKEDLSWEDAQELEIFLIEQYGRRDLGTGPLVNLTNGGDGLINPSPEVRAKISIYSKGSMNNMYGTSRTRDTNPNAKLVLDTNSGIFYTCAKDAAEAFNIPYGRLVKYLCGQNKNNTTLIYV
jgi:hypothetical protein